MRASGFFLFSVLIATVGALLDGEMIFGNDIRDTVGVGLLVGHQRRCQRKPVPGVTNRCSRSIGVWVPNWLSTSGDLGVFVDQPAEPIAPLEVRLGWRRRWW